MIDFLNKVAYEYLNYATVHNRMILLFVIPAVTIFENQVDVLQTK